MPQSSPDQMPAGIADGRPHRLSSEARMAYWIWHDADNVWHLRTTTQRTRHGFTGLIHPLPGTTIVNIQPVAPKRRDELGLINGDLKYNFHPRENVDGIDFQLTGPGAIELALRIDGDYDPTHIFVGSHEQQPSNAHFIISP
jgi:hypothetical protein